MSNKSGLVITLTFSEPPAVSAWCFIVDAIAKAYPGAQLCQPTSVTAYVTTIEVPEVAP